MNITTNALFVVAAIAMGVWMKKDPGFKKREFIATALFMVIVVSTPWGGSVVDTVQHFLYTAAQTAGDTANNLSAG